MQVHRSNRLLPVLGIAEERRAVMATLGTPDQQEGMRAFLENPDQFERLKREPELLDGAEDPRVSRPIEVRRGHGAQPDLDRLRREEHRAEESLLGLEVVGRDAVSEGRLVMLSADGETTRIRIPSLRQAWSIRRRYGALLISLIRASSRSGLKIALEIGRGISIPLAPTPSVLLRLIHPSLRGV